MRRLRLRLRSGRCVVTDEEVLAAAQRLGELIGDMGGEIEAQTVFLRVIMRKLGVTGQEIEAQYELVKEERRRA